MKIDQSNHAHAGTAKSDFAAIRTSNSEPFAEILARKVPGTPKTQTGEPAPRLTGEQGIATFNSVLDDLLQQPELTSQEKFHLVGEAALRNLSSVTCSQSTAVDEISSIIQKLSKNDPHILQATHAWLASMQPNY